MNWLEISEVARQLWVAWMMLIFLGIAFYAFRPKNRQHFRDCAQIPFKAEDDGRHDPSTDRKAA
jgi:cytochrome c oxidase cbb3-type subunit IV